MLKCLAQDAAAPVCGALEQTWGTFEGQLLRHLEAEERFLLPLLEASDPAEVSRIRAEHARIRELVTELGPAIELHAVREANVTRLIDFLKAHAEHENRALYRLAGDKASSAVLRGISEWLKRGASLAKSVISAGSAGGGLGSGSVGR